MHPNGEDTVFSEQELFNFFPFQQRGTANKQKVSAHISFLR